MRSGSIAAARHAGVVQRQNTSFPSLQRGFDSRHPLHRPSVSSLRKRRERADPRVGQQPAPPPAAEAQRHAAVSRHPRSGLAVGNVPHPPARRGSQGRRRRRPVRPGPPSAAPTPVRRRTRRAQTTSRLNAGGKVLATPTPFLQDLIPQMAATGGGAVSHPRHRRQRHLDLRHRRPARNPDLHVGPAGARRRERPGRTVRRHRA